MGHAELTRLLVDIDTATAVLTRVKQCLDAMRNDVCQALDALDGQLLALG